MRFDASLIRREFRHLWQEARWGYSDRDTWDLSLTIAQFALPRLKRFKKVNNGYPCDLSEEQWDEILDKMIWSLEEKCKDEIYPDGCSDIPAYLKKREEGIALFGKYFEALWW